MMERLVLLIAFLIAVSIKSHSQLNQSGGDNLFTKMIPPSPEASALIKYSEIPVGYYTGTPDISLPITAITSGNLSLPVSLSYNASGNRVSEIATFVGQGWVLQAGGQVSRVVRGLPDDTPGTGFLHFIQRPNMTEQFLLSGNNADRVPILRSVADGCDDAEPDLFYFNFNGYSGKFFFDWQGQLQISSQRKVKVEPIHETSSKKITAWEFTTDDGSKYLFDVLDHTQTNNYGGLGCKLLQPYVSSWYLSKIEDVNNLNRINLKYNNYPIRYLFEANESNRHLVGNSLNAVNPPCNGSFAGSADYTVYTLTHSGKVISKIYTEDESFAINFDYNQTRKDVVEEAYAGDLKSLDEIRISYKGQEVDRVSLSFDYSVGRLTLRSVKFKSHSGPYRIDYNHIKLPSRKSKSQDHWGYYNTNTKNSLIPSATIYRSNGTPVIFDGANRSPDALLMKAGIIKRLTLPTGGFNEFEFEPHDYIYTQGGKINEKVASSKDIGLTKVGTCLSGDCVRESGWQEVPFVIGNIKDQTHVQFSVEIQKYGEPYFGLNRDPAVEIVNSSGVVVLRAGLSDGVGSRTYYFDKSRFPAGNYVLRVRAHWQMVLDNKGNIGVDYASGYLKWTEESEDFLKSKMAGGLRIKSVSEYESTSDPNPRKRFFEYRDESGFSTGVIYTEPKYQYDITTFTIGLSVISECECYYVLRLTSNIINHESTQNSHVGYKNIKVKLGENAENGYSIYSYTTPLEFGDLISTSPPFPPAITQNFKTGLLLNEEHYNANGKLVAQTENQYQFREKSTSAYKISFKGGNDGIDYLYKYEVGYYRINIGHHQLLTTNTKQFDGTLFHENEKLLSFDSDLQNLKQEVTNANNKQLVSTFFYADDFPVTSPSNINLMKRDQLHIVSAPIEIISVVRKHGMDELINASFSEYTSRLINGKNALLLDKSYAFNKAYYSGEFQIAVNSNGLRDENIYAARPVMQVNDYNSKGMPVDLIDNSGINKAYVWGYSDTYPIAEVLNATANNVFYTSFEEDGVLDANARTGRRVLQGNLNFVPPSNLNCASGCVLSYWYWQNGKWQYKETAYSGGNLFIEGEKFDEFRISPVGSIMTTYTYDPYIGRTSTTDANNTTTYYEYNNLGRLATVKDDDGNVLKNYHYQFRIQQ